ncbi:DUF4023 family protein [Metabacillus flavus]
MMEKTNEFLNNLHERQEKDEANRKHQGKGNAGKDSPSKTHKE